jgi:hypothetical protein
LTESAVRLFMPWHPLDDDDDNPEPDWGQYHEGPRPVPDTVITMRVAQPAEPEPPSEPAPDPAGPDFDALYALWAEHYPFRDERDPDAPWDTLVPCESRRATMRRAPSRRRVRPTPEDDLSDPVVDTPGGLMRRSRVPMGNHRGDLDQIELRAYEQEPRYVRMMRRRHWDHWRA